MSSFCEDNSFRIPKQFLPSYIYIQNQLMWQIPEIKKGAPNGTPLRYLADSNRRTWFCRPLTKPLIQGTGWQGLTFSDDKGKTFFVKNK